MTLILSFILTMSAHAADDRCVEAYDAGHPVTAMLEKSINRGSLISSQWVVCGGRAFVDESKCGKDTVETRFAFGADKAHLTVKVNGLSDDKVQKIAETMSGGAAVWKSVIQAALKTGLDFNASLCVRPQGSAYVKLAGSGMAKGKGGIIEVSRDDQSVQVRETFGTANSEASK